MVYMELVPSFVRLAVQQSPFPRLTNAEGLANWGEGRQLKLCLLP